MRVTYLSLRCGPFPFGPLRSCRSPQRAGGGVCAPAGRSRAGARPSAHSAGRTGARRSHTTSRRAGSRSRARHRSPGPEPRPRLILDQDDPEPALSQHRRTASPSRVRRAIMGTSRRDGEVALRALRVASAGANVDARHPPWDLALSRSHPLAVLVRASEPKPHDAPAGAACPDETQEVLVPDRQHAPERGAGGRSCPGAMGPGRRADAAVWAGPQGSRRTSAGSRMRPWRTRSSCGSHSAGPPLEPLRERELELAADRQPREVERLACAAVLAGEHDRAAVVVHQQPRRRLIAGVGQRRTPPPSPPPLPMPPIPASRPARRESTASKAGTT